MKRLFCLKAKNGLGRFAPSASTLPHYNLGTKERDQVLGACIVPGTGMYVCTSCVLLLFIVYDTRIRSVFYLSSMKNDMQSSTQSQLPM